MYKSSLEIRASIPVKANSFPKHSPPYSQRHKQALLENILQKQKNKIHHQLQLNAVKKNLSNSYSENVAKEQKHSAWGKKLKQGG